MQKLSLCFLRPQLPQCDIGRDAMFIVKAAPQGSRPMPSCSARWRSLSADNRWRNASIAAAVATSTSE